MTIHQSYFLKNHKICAKNHSMEELLIRKGLYWLASSVLLEFIKASFCYAILREFLVGML